MIEVDAPITLWGASAGVGHFKGKISVTLGDQVEEVARKVSSTAEMWPVCGRAGCVGCAWAILPPAATSSLHLTCTHRHPASVQAKEDGVGAEAATLNLKKAGCLSFLF